MSERSHGFLKVVRALEKEISRVRKTDSVNIKRDVLKALEDEYALFKEMYLVEKDIAEGQLTRGPRKFLLQEDGYTYKRNPKWYPQGDI